MKIINQDKTAIFSLDNCNVFCVEEVVYITQGINVYDGKAAILGHYENKEEAEDVLWDLFVKIKEKDIFYEMPQIGELLEEELGNEF